MIPVLCVGLAAVLILVAIHATGRGKLDLVELHDDLCIHEHQS